MGLPADDNPDPPGLRFRNPTSRASCWAPHPPHSVARLQFPATDPSLDGPEPGSPSATVYLAARSDDWSRSERSEEHTSELQSRGHLVCRLLLEKKKIVADGELRLRAGAGYADRAPRRQHRVGPELGA